MPAQAPRPPGPRRYRPRVPLQPLPELADLDPGDRRLTALPAELRPWLRDYLSLKDV